MVVALGNLNLIAAIVSMFFVVTYGLLNYATYFEARAKSPSFRPALRWYRGWISLVGWLGALGVMLAIDLISGLLAVAIVTAIYQYLKRSAAAARWADGQRSYHLQIVRDHLIAANAGIEHPRDWRPQILAFSNDSARRERLLTFADWIEGHSGLTTVVRVLEGRGRHMRRAREEAEAALEKELAPRSSTPSPWSSTARTSAPRSRPWSRRPASARSGPTPSWSTGSSRCGTGIRRRECGSSAGTSMRSICTAATS